jgi:hypothetical protein
MLSSAPGSRSAPADLATRQRIALDRIQQLIATSEERAARTWRNYYVLQGVTIAFAAITPCLIVLAKENPHNPVLNWLQLFLPALAAISAGLSHIFRWREEGVRNTNLAQALRSELWRFQTRVGPYGLALSDDEALDRLVTRVDDVNLQSVARWNAAQSAETPPPASGAKPAAAAAER